MLLRLSVVSIHLMVQIVSIDSSIKLESLHLFKYLGGQASTATPAKYDYQYKIADDGTQTYISQQGKNSRDTD